MLRLTVRDELIITEYLTLQTGCRTNRCCYNRVRLQIQETSLQQSLPVCTFSSAYKLIIFRCQPDNRTTSNTAVHTKLQINVSLTPRPALSQVVIQLLVVNPYRRFGATYRSHLQVSRNPKIEPVHAMVIQGEWRYSSIISQPRHQIEARGCYALFY